MTTVTLIHSTGYEQVWVVDVTRDLGDEGTLTLRWTVDYIYDADGTPWSFVDPIGVTFDAGRLAYWRKHVLTAILTQRYTNAEAN